MKITIAAGVTLVLISGLWLGFRFLGTGEKEVDTQGRLPETSVDFRPFSAYSPTFFGEIGERTAESGTTASREELGLVEPKENGAPPLAATEIGQVGLPPIPAPITFSTPYAPPTYGAKLLPLPAVDERELAVGEDGAKNFSEYMDQVIVRAQNISFPYQKFQAVAQEAGNFVLFAEEVAEEAISERNFLKYQNSFETMREFSEYKINELETIKTIGAGLEVNKNFIAMEKLKISLMDKALQTGKGELSQEEFSSFYKQYSETVTHHLNSLKNNYGTTLKNHGFFAKISRALGLLEVADAFLPVPFGGLISVTIPCPCSFGASLTVGPPVGGKFFVSAFGSRIYPFFKLFPGSWILGDYASTPMTCLEPAVPVCVPIDYSQGLVMIAGTSL